MKLTSTQYTTLCNTLRNSMGITLANKLISATQSAFGSVDNVVAYYAKGLVCFDNGQRWIYNFNELYPRFYRVDVCSDSFKIVPK